jgi:hypothetical protein
MGCSFSVSVLIAKSNILFASSALGDVPMVLAIGKPLKTIDHGRKIYLPSRDMKLCDVCKP